MMRWPWQSPKPPTTPRERGRTDELVREAERIGSTMRDLHEQSRRLNRRQSALVEALRRANEAIGRLDDETDPKAIQDAIDAMRRGLMWHGWIAE